MQAPNTANRSTSAKHRVHRNPAPLERPDAARRPTRSRAGPILLGMLLGLVLTVGAVSLIPIGALWGQVDDESAAHRTGSDHDDHDHDDGNAIALSEQARQNIGLTLVSVVPRDFARSITVPGVIRERPGRTLLTVSAPLRGIITRILPVDGESVAPETALFELRMTDENLADRQRALLLAVENLQVVQQEIDRLEKVTASGAIAGKARLERQYEASRIEAAIRTEKQALVVLGLHPDQVDQIVADRRLLSTIQVAAPPLFSAGSSSDPHEYHVVELPVRPGDRVEAGSPLAVLANHAELYVEGRAFDRDAAALHRTAEKGTGVRVLIEEEEGDRREIPDLPILYVENQVDRQSRALQFYVTLPNEIVRDRQLSDGRRFRSWRFKPGQRVEVEVPVEHWEGRLVLPIEAVVQEGAETFVFQEEGDHFLRRTIHVEYRDRRWAVVGADSTLEPGSVVAAKGAYQIHLALKQQAGGSDLHDDHHHH